MLADAIRALREEQERIKQAEIEKYNHPYKRDTIIYFSDIHIIGGIQTWIQNLSKEYEFSVVYDTGSPERIKYMNDMGIETIKYVGQDIECNTLLTCLFGNPDKIKAKQRIIVVHGDYKHLDMGEIPKHDGCIAVSKVAAESFQELTGIKTDTIYNPVSIDLAEEPLIFGVFSRLSKEKGKWRVQLLIEKLKASGRPFLMLISTDLPFEESDKRVIFIPPMMNPIGWMRKCDYICLLSDTEACPYNVLESLKMKKPLIITRLPILEELGVNESNSKIVDFDMNNLDIDDLWNIPTVDWKEPESKGWEKYMKKRALREKRTEKPVKAVVEEPKKTTKKKAK